MPASDMPDPITGHLGQLICTGWIGTASDTGRDAAFLLLATPDAQAASTMPNVAARFGMNPRPGSVTPHVEISVSVGADLWLHLHELDGSDLGVTMRVTQEWESTARGDGRVVLVIGFQLLPAGVGMEAYADQLTAANAMALGLAIYTPDN